MQYYESEFYYTIARRRLSKTAETLPETARAMNFSTLELVEILDSNEWALVEDRIKHEFADHISEQAGTEIKGETGHLRYEKAKALSKGLSKINRYPDSW